MNNIMRKLTINFMIIAFALGFSGCLGSIHRRSEKSINQVLNPNSLSSGDSSKVLQNEQNIEIDTFLIIQNSIYNQFEGSEMESFVYGDLDTDGDNDVLVVATKTCGEHESVSDHSRCFRLLLFIAKGGGEFELSRVNETLIECSDCYHSGPYFTVNDGIIEIVTSYGTCHRDVITEKYKYYSRDKNWYLESVEKYTVNCEPVNGEIEITEYPKSTRKDFGKIKL